MVPGTSGCCARRPADRLLEQPHLGVGIEVVLGELDARAHVEQVPHGRAGVPADPELGDVRRQRPPGRGHRASTSAPATVPTSDLLTDISRCRVSGAIRTGYCSASTWPSGMTIQPSVSVCRHDRRRRSRSSRRGGRPGGSPASTRRDAELGDRARRRGRSPPSGRARRCAGTTSAAAARSASCPASRRTRLARLAQRPPRATPVVAAPQSPPCARRELASCTGHPYRRLRHRLAGAPAACHCSAPGPTSIRCFARMVSPRACLAFRSAAGPCVTSTPRSAPFQR